METLSVNELRIGNFFEYKKRIIQFAIEDFTEISNNDQFLELFLNPIPLTEQWLKDFGFKESNDRWHESYPFYIKWCDWTPGGWWLLCDIDIPIRQIEYVHQLQNLYFALTGNELIKK